jgi:hypothetical protein
LAGERARAWRAHDGRCCPAPIVPALINTLPVQPQDAIDFTDNDIQILGNFPLSPRLTTLLFARNRISNIQPGVARNVPFLRNLVLVSNHFAELADLDGLAGFKRLTHLVLADNPVAKKEHYRYWVLWRCPSVRFLDYQKVKAVEREAAAELFGTEEEPTELAQRVGGACRMLGREQFLSSLCANARTSRSWAAGPRLRCPWRPTARRRRRPSSSR